MTRRAICRLGVLVAALAAHPMPAAAHRLDEYLQATRIAIDDDRIVLEIDLTPGASIASRVFVLIDADRDGRIDDAEADMYAHRVLEAISLTIDGRRLSVRPTNREVPTFDDMALGTGSIRLRAVANASFGSGTHRLAYRNSHAPDASAYLVNALVPTDSRVQLGAPRRDALQRELTLDFAVAPDPTWLRAGWVAVAATVFLTLGVARQRRALVASAMMLAMCATVGLVACGARKPNTLAVPVDARFTLAPGEMTTITGTEVVVRFDRVVEDSRCPTGVACIQAGDGVIGITVTQRGGTTGSYQLHTAPNGARSAVHGGVTIALEDLVPVPASSRATPPRDYRATLRASR
jgi:hypothetical protein